MSIKTNAQQITGMTIAGYVKNDASGNLSGGNAGSSGAPTDATYLTVTSNGTLTDERILMGTANQIVLTDNGAGSTLQLSTPQNIHAAAAPTFSGLTLLNIGVGSVLFGGAAGVIS